MQATLRSNDGEAEFTLELSSTSDYAHDIGFDSSICLRGQHWDGEHTFPFSVSIEGFWLRAHDVTALRDHITEWTRQPFDRLTPVNLSGEFKLTRLPERRLSVVLGAPEGNSTRNPTISVAFAAGALHGKFSFETDQSCLGIFAHALSKLPDDQVSDLPGAPKGQKQTSPGQRPGSTERKQD
jgi:hypothetical protein